MNFDTSAALDQTALAVGIGFNANLPALAAGESLTHLYLHWAVTGYHACDSAYNGVISLDPVKSLWDATITADPRLNATEPVQDGYAAHTYLRNSHAFGLAVAGMIDATPSDFGPNPITLHEVETLCAVGAAVCLKYGIDSTQAALVMTHGEAAILDGYFITDSPSDGVTRWDLARLSASDNAVTKDECVNTGNQLRQRIHQYKLEMMKPAHV